MKSRATRIPCRVSFDELEDASFLTTVSLRFSAGFTGSSSSFSRVCYSLASRDTRRRKPCRSEPDTREGNGASRVPTTLGKNKEHNRVTPPTRFPPREIVRQPALAANTSRFQFAIVPNNAAGNRETEGRGSLDMPTRCGKYERVRGDLRRGFRAGAAIRVPSVIDFELTQVTRTETFDPSLQRVPSLGYLSRSILFFTDDTGTQAFELTEVTGTDTTDPSS